MTDPYDRLVALRPPVPDEDGWADSVEGRAALARVLATATPPKVRWWRRKAVIVPVAVLGLGGAVAAGAAFAPAGRDAASDTTISCIGTTSDGYRSFAGTTLAPHAAHDLIVAQCNAVADAAGDPAPVDWAECVVPPDRDQSGGAEVAIPSDVVVTDRNHAAVCQQARLEPIR